MAVEEEHLNQALLIDGLNGLTLNVSDECLPFHPPENKQSPRKVFHDIPHYLFRVCTPKSAGETDHSWTRSLSARNGGENCGLDIFHWTDRNQVALMINCHLRWWKNDNGNDSNLVSWTSSLLFALVYIFYLRASERDGSDLDKIHLCIIDRTKFPDHVFIRDLDLISAYESNDTLSSDRKGLTNLHLMRTKPPNYFGEYLSQGALKIKDKCRIISAQEIIDKGLYDLEPKFEEFSRWPQESKKPPWAKEVVRFREGFDQQIEDQPVERFEKKLTAAIDIAQLFGSEWTLPMAASLIALLPHWSQNRGIILQELKKLPLIGSFILPTV